LTFDAIYDTILCIKSKKSVRINGGFFYSFFNVPHNFLCGFFLYQTDLTMQLNLITNNDNTKIVQYKIARIVYAETGGESLAVVEAMSSMIYNIHIKYDKSFEDIANDKNLFEVLNESSNRHQYLKINADDRKFQMCLRTVQTMMHGNLRDYVFGATKFHHANVIPDWATACGYIAEYADILFYL
jgi:hypothetical protein